MEFLTGMGKLGNPIIFSGNGRNRGQTDAGAVLVGGQVNMILLLYHAVKAVGGHQIQIAAVL